MHTSILTLTLIITLLSPALAAAQTDTSAHTLTAGVSGGLSGPRGVAGASVAVGARYVELEGGVGIRLPKFDCDPATASSVHDRARPVGSVTLRGLMPFDKHTWHFGAGLSTGQKTWCSPDGAWVPGFLPSEGTLYRIDRAYWFTYGFGLRRPITDHMDIGGDIGFMALLNRTGGSCSVNCPLDAPDSRAGGGAFYLNLQMRWGML